MGPLFIIVQRFVVVEVSLNNGSTIAVMGEIEIFCSINWLYISYDQIWTCWSLSSNFVHTMLLANMDNIHYIVRSYWFNKLMNACERVMRHFIFCYTAIFDVFVYKFFLKLISKWNYYLINCFFFTHSF